MSNNEQNSEKSGKKTTNPENKSNNQQVKDCKKARLAEALRKNLRRRKNTPPVKNSGQ